MFKTFLVKTIVNLNKLIRDVAFNYILYQIPPTSAKLIALTLSREELNNHSFPFYRIAIGLFVLFSCDLRCLLSLEDYKPNLAVPRKVYGDPDLECPISLI